MFKMATEVNLYLFILKMTREYKSNTRNEISKIENYTHIHTLFGLEVDNSIKFNMASCGHIVFDKFPMRWLMGFLGVLNEVLNAAK